MKYSGEYVTRAQDQGPGMICRRNKNPPDVLEVVGSEEFITKINREEVRNENPALMLLDFYARANSLHGAEVEALGIRSMDLTRALEVAPGFGEQRLGALSTNDVERWIEYWRSIRFISAH